MSLNANHKASNAFDALYIFSPLTSSWQCSSYFIYLSYLFTTEVALIFFFFIIKSPASTISVMY